MPKHRANKQGNRNPNPDYLTPESLPLKTTSLAQFILIPERSSALGTVTLWKVWTWPSAFCPLRRYNCAWHVGGPSFSSGSFLPSFRMPLSHICSLCSGTRCQVLNQTLGFCFHGICFSACGSIGSPLCFHLSPSSHFTCSLCKCLSLRTPAPARSTCSRRTSWLERQLDRGRGAGGTPHTLCFCLWAAEGQQLLEQAGGKAGSHQRQMAYCPAAAPRAQRVALEH